MWSPCCRRTQWTVYKSAQGHAVRKPGDHKGRPYSRQCWRTPLFPSLTARVRPSLLGTAAARFIFLK